MNEEQLRIWTPIMISGIVSIVTGLWALINQLRIDKLKFEHHIQFIELHKERLIFIKDLYKKIARIQDLLIPLVAGEIDRFDEVHSDFESTFNDLKPFFFKTVYSFQRK